MQQCGDKLYFLLHALGHFLDPLVDPFADFQPLGPFARPRDGVALGEPAPIPIIVLSAGNTPPQLLEERDQMADRSPRGRHIIARKSGHWIQLDEPRLVVDAIREMIETSNMATDKRR